MSRYSQQIAVSEFRLIGQVRMQAASVLIVGAGGLGVPLALYLNAAGIGKIGIIDGDVVEMANLHRQVCYTPADIGQAKSAVLASFLRKQNPDTEIVEYPKMLTNANATPTINAYQIICDCTDNGDTPLLINQTCRDLKKPLVYAAVRAWEGYITVLHYKHKVDLEDIFSRTLFQENSENTCESGGIINATCGIAASHQATEVYKIIHQASTVLDGKILCFNSLENRHIVLKLKI